MIRLRKGEAYVFSTVVYATQDVVVVEINFIRVADKDPTIALRSNWSCLSQRIWLWFEFEEGDATSGRVISARGHNFESSTKPSKSYPNRRYVN